MRREVCVCAILALILALMTLAGCGNQPMISAAPEYAAPLATPVGTSDQATLEAALTQQQNNADIQAVATAEIMRAYAQATLNSAYATLSAAQTQEQNNANIIAAQVAATVEFARANAQATLVAADSTQSAALTLDTIRQTQTQYELQITQVAGTLSAEAIIAQQT